MINRSYAELRRLETFEERFRYLLLKGQVGDPTFGCDRHINQRFYTSREWKDVRQFVIARDFGCDLGIEGYEIFANLHIHHMTPMTPDHIIHRDPMILDPENLITTSHQTHNAIHFGDERQLPRQLVERQPGDTKLW